MSAKPLERRNRLKEKFKKQQVSESSGKNKQFKSIKGLIKISPKTIEWYNNAFGGGPDE